jgi:hypothetical protein
MKRGSGRDSYIAVTPIFAYHFRMIISKEVARRLNSVTVIVYALVISDTERKSLRVRKTIIGGQGKLSRV